jgi:hypothetical protein
MALLAVFTGRERLLAIVTGPAIFFRPEGLHSQSVAPIRTALLFFEQDIMAIGTTCARRLVTFVTEYHRRETFGILENDVSNISIRLHRHPTPQQTGRNEDRQTENPHSKFHRPSLVQMIISHEIDPIISRSRPQFDIIFTSPNRKIAP